MGLATVFKLSIYILTGFVGVILGAAEYGFIPFISIPVTVFAYWWCETGLDRAGNRRGLSESVALVLGFLSLLAASFEFFSENYEGRLLAGIHLVVYLTWVVLLQQKSNYRYWLLMTLGMMHVAVGAVLTSSNWYGACMVVYLFGAIWTLSVFSLYRVAQDFAAIEPDSPNGIPKSVTARSSSQSEVFDEIRLENNASWISLRMVSGVAFTSFAGLFIGAAFFALVPRVWVGTALGISDDALPAAMKRVTGQATEVRLGDLGQILVSNDPVLSLKIYDLKSDEQVSTHKFAESLGMSEPMFRGAVLTNYAAGNWKPISSGNTIISIIPRAYDSLSKTSVEAAFRQEIHLERIGTNVLYCLGRPLAMRDREGSRVANSEVSSQLAIRRDWFESLPGAVEYIVFTGPPKPDEFTQGARESSYFHRSDRYIKACLEVSGDLGRLSALAQKVRDDEAERIGQPLTPIETAKAIESYLRDSGEYSYSLSTPVVDPDIDPVEDFLFNRRTGHCQYFATALALMLRAVNIPSRVVTGFKGGIEQADGTLNVEKRFAHAWVEACTEGRHWVAFDATPEDGRAESVTEIGANKNMFALLTSRLAVMWESNILDVSLERQELLIYEPLREWVNALIEFQQSFVKSPREAMKELIPKILDLRNWLSLPGLLVLTLLFASGWLIRRKSAWLRNLLKRRARTTSDSNRRIEFYERFVKLMKSTGRVQQQGQTQQEFTSEVAPELARRLGDVGVEPHVQAVASLFYRVRFGESELTEHEASEMNELLGRLEKELDPKHRRHATTA
ncbi:MAG: transglutaminaseTgpA domain-containing protein [Planctomycetaceae bacterium]